MRWVFGSFGGWIHDETWKMLRSEWSSLTWFLGCFFGGYIPNRVQVSVFEPSTPFQYDDFESCDFFGRDPLIHRSWEKINHSSLVISPLPIGQDSISVGNHKKLRNRIDRLHLLDIGIASFVLGVFVNKWWKKPSSWSIFHRETHG